MTKSFSELTEDQKMMRIFNHVLNAPQDVPESEHNEAWFRERYNLVEFVREKLDFLRAFHKIKE